MKIRFLGATHQVTGSSYLLEVGDLKILIDCGMYQESELTHRNWENFPVSPNQISHLLVTHVHQDHIGLIPKLVKDGFAGDILMTPASKDLFPIVILDSAHIQEEDAAFKNRHKDARDDDESHPETPLYTVQDAERCLPLIKTLPYGEYLQLNESVKACFHDAGHILGSAMIEVVVQDEKGSRNIVFSGDIGQWDKPILPNPSVFDHADYVVMECTYGDRDHVAAKDVDNRLSEVVNETVKMGGNILIPTFAIERAQELLYHFSLLARDGRIPYIVTFLDSPMAVEVTKVFEQSKKYFDEETQRLFKDSQSPFDFPGLKLVESVEGSKAINLIKGSAVILSGSGMVTGGRIRHHLIREISRPESALLFVGYQAAGTLGRRILDGVSPVQIFGQSYPVRIRLESLEGLSAHAGMSDLHRWLNNFKSPPKRIFLTHGEEASISSIQSYLSSMGGWSVTAPVYLEEHEI
jgi:metallo-beta-lactamase family protein